VRLLSLSFVCAVAVAVGLVPAAASAATTQQQAQAKALDALNVSGGTDALVVFKLARPVAAGTVISAAGRSGGPAAATTSAARSQAQRLRAAGVAVVSAPRVTVVGDEPAWFFYEDQAPYQSYAHAGRVVLVGAETGRVTVTKTLQWPPVIAGRLPSFLRSSAAYRDARYRAFDRPWTSSTPAVAPATLPAPGSPIEAAGARKQAADALAAEHSCAVRVSDTLGDFYDAASVDQSRARIGVFMNALSRLNPGFVSTRYRFATVRGGESLKSFISKLLAKRGCKDLMLYVAGGGYVTRGQSVINVGTRVRRDGRIEQQTVTASALRGILRAHPGVTFKIMLDAPYSGGFGTVLRDAPNLLVFLASASATQGSFTALPEVRDPQGRPVLNTYNKAQLLEFSNRELTGLYCFIDSPGEVAAATRAKADGTSKSFFAWMLARAFSLCSAGSVSSTVQGAPQPVITQPGLGLGSPATPAPVAPPAAPAPATTSAGAGTTPGTQDPGTPTLLAPVVTLTSGGLSYTENDAATIVDAGLTVTDADSTSLSGATVRIATGFAAGQDVLELSGAAPAGITSSYDPATGTLTLTGSAPIASYQAALRDVAYRNTSDAPSAAARSIRFAVTDTAAGTSTAVARDLAVSPVNDGPTADDDAYTVAADATLTVPASTGVLANDADLDGDSLTVDQVAGSAGNVGNVLTTTGGAHVTINANGSLTYDPNSQFDVLTAGQSDTDTVTYRATDGGLNDTATVTFTITGVNDAPVAVDDAYSVGQNGVLTVPAATGVLDNDTDGDGDTLTVDQVAGSGASVGTQVTTTGGAHATINADGSLTYDPNGQFDILNAGQTGTDTVTYRAADGHGGTDTATITITIIGATDAPVAVDDAYSVGQSAALTVPAATGVLDNDTDADDDTLSVDQVAGSGANVGTVYTTTGGALVTINADGSLTYDPNHQFDALGAGQSDTDTVTYRATDGGLNGTATVTFTINGANDAPVAVDDAYSVGQSTVLTVPAATGVVDNDTDGDGDSLTVDQVAGSASNVATAYTTTGGAHATVNANGSLTYDPNGQFDDLGTAESATDTVTYRVSDGHGGTDTATITFTVNGANDAPVAVDDAYSTNEDTVLTVNAATGVVNNDTDVDGDALTVDQVAGSGANVGTAHTTTGGATVTVNANGSLSYNPNGQFDDLGAGQQTTDTVTYRVSDGSLNDTATITFTVTGVNDAPVASDDSYSTDEDTTLTVNAATGVLNNDTDPEGTALTVDQVAGSAGNVGTVLTTTGGAHATINANGSITYDPNGQFNDLGTGEQETDTVTYRTTDGGLNDTATITFTVTGVNDAPDATDDAYSTDEDTVLTVPAGTGVLTNDTDPDGDALTVDQVGGSGANVGNAFTSTGGATVTVNANGSLSYNPNGQFNSLTVGQQTTDTFIYRTTDGALDETATVTITITGVNDAPTATDDSYAGVGNTTLVVGNTVPAGRAGKTLSGSIKSNDTDPDTAAGSLTITTGTSATTLGGSVTMDADGTFTYTPPTSTTNTADTFTYTIGDGTSTDTGTVTINLTSRVWYVDNTAAAGGTGRSSDPFDTLAEATAAGGANATIFVHQGSGTTGQNAGAVLAANERLLGAAEDLVVGGDTLYDGSNAQRPTIGNAAGAGVTLASGSTVQGLAINAAGGAAISGSAGVSGSTIADVTLSGTSGGLSLSATSGTFAISDTTISTTGGTGLTASGAGTVNFTSAGTISVASSGARALNISSTALSGTIDDVTVTASAAGGVALQNTTGSIVLGGLSLATTGGTGFLADNVAGLSVPAGATANVSDSGGTAVAIRNSTAPSATFDTVSATGAGSTGIDVSGNGGGGTTTFSGATTTSTSTATGVSLANNAGHAIAFTGGNVGITTTSGRGFDATGGGTVTVQGSGSTITSTTGTALRIANTTIGSSDVTFRSISANGAPNGIVLDTTGSNGGLKVTGTNTAGSGGTIQNTAGADGTTQGIGVYLNSTMVTSLKYLNLSNNAGWAIRGTTVSDFSLDGATISGTNGTNDALDEASVAFTQLLGTSSITNTAISGGVEDNLRVSNTSGTANLTLDGITVGANNAATGGNGVLLEARQTAAETTTVKNSTFTSSREDLFQSIVTDQASNDLTFTNNTLNNGQAVKVSGGAGVILATSGSGSGANLVYRIAGNTVNGNDNAIFVQKGVGIATARGRIENNIVGTAGVTGSGANAGSGITVESRGQGTHVSRIAGNTVRQYNQDGISTVNGEDGSGDNGSVNVQLTVVNNTVTEPKRPQTLTGFRNEAADPAATVDECLDLQGNVMTGAGPFGSDIRVLFDFAQNTVRLPGYAGGSADTTAVRNYFAGRNTATTLVAGHPGSGPGYVNGGAGCTQPPA
jgi:VCBS repeat-containing protein